MKKKTRSKVRYTDDKGEIQGELRIVRRGELPDLDALLDKLPEKTKVTLELRQFGLGILQAGSSEAKYELSAHDPEPGAFLRSISHLTNNKTGFESGCVTALTFPVTKEAPPRV